MSKIEQLKFITNLSEIKIVLPTVPANSVAKPYKTYIFDIVKLGTNTFQVTKAKLFGAIHHNLYFLDLVKEDRYYMICYDSGGDFAQSYSSTRLRLRS